MKRQPLLPSPPPQDPELVARARKVLLLGNAPAAVEAALGGQNPEADAKLVVAEALEQFVQAGSVPQKVVLGFCLEAYRELYREAMAAKDHEAATKILSAMAAAAKTLPIVPRRPAR
jgi:hypothetical protein